MAVEDLLLNIGTNVTGESDLDSLISKLGTLDVLEDSVDPITIDVEVNDADNALDDINNIRESVVDIDQADIGDDIVSGVSDGGIADGATDGGGSTGDSRFDRLNVAQLEYLRDHLGDSFDWRALLRDDLTAPEMQPGGNDQSLFEFPREVDAQDLIGSNRESSGLETLIDEDAVEDVIAKEGLQGLFVSDQDRRRELIDLPGRGPSTPWRDRLFGERENGRRRGGLLQPFQGLNMSQFYTALAQLLPLIFVFIGAMPAAIAALGSLAAAAGGAAIALGGVVGLGLLGAAASRGGGDLATGMQEIMKTIRRDFLNAFLPLAERFDDLFADGLQGLGRLFDAIAARGDTLVQFKNNVRALGGFALEFIPKAIDLLVQLGDVFSPVFAMFGEWLSMNFGNILGGLANIFSRALPSILRFIDAFMQFLPFLIDLSMGFLVAASFIMQFFGAIGNVLSLLGPFGTGIAVIIGLLIGLGTITSMIASLTGVQFVMGIAKAIASLVSYTIATYGALTGTLLLLTGIVALTGGLFALFSALGMAATGFGSMAGKIDEATKAMNQFDSARSGVGGFGGNTSGLQQGSLSVYNDNSKTVYNGSGDDADSMNRFQKRQNYQNKMFGPYQG